MKLSPARLLILTYHRVLGHPDWLRPTLTHTDQFTRQLSVIRRFFNAFTVSDAMRRLQENRLPYRSLAITFDDGYRDNAEVALPVLKRFGLPATFFVASCYRNGGIMWNDKIVEAVRLCEQDHLDLTPINLKQYDLSSKSCRSSAVQALLRELKYLPQGSRDTVASNIATLAQVSLPANMMMTDQDLRQLDAEGMEIGAHTVSHPILSALNDDQAQREIESGKQDLEAVVGTPVIAFAYPNGKPGIDFDRRHVEMVRAAGFACAVTTAPGAVHADSDHWQLGRIAPYDQSRIKFTGRLLHGYTLGSAATTRT